MRPTWDPPEHGYVINYSMVFCGLWLLTSIPCLQQRVSQSCVGARAWMSKHRPLFSEDVITYACTVLLCYYHNLRCSIQFHCNARVFPRRSLQYRYGKSNYIHEIDCLFNNFLSYQQEHQSSALLSLCGGTVGFFAQRDSNDEGVSMPWRHHDGNVRVIPRW